MGFSVRGVRATGWEICFCGGVGFPKDLGFMWVWGGFRVRNASGLYIRWEFPKIGDPNIVP